MSQILGVDGEVPLKAGYFTANPRQCACGAQARVEDPESAGRCGILDFPEGQIKWLLFHAFGMSPAVNSRKALKMKK
jgi:hypothetical protein